MGKELTSSDSRPTGRFADEKMDQRRQRGVRRKKEEGRERRRDSPEDPDLSEQRLSLIQIRKLDGGFKEGKKTLRSGEPEEKKRRAKKGRSEARRRERREDSSRFSPSVCLFERAKGQREVSGVEARVKQLYSPKRVKAARSRSLNGKGNGLVREAR